MMIMDYFQPVEIDILSAQDLNTKHLLFRPKVYVSVSVTRGSRDHQATPSAVYSKKFLRWNYRMRFYIEDDKIQNNESVFVFQIKCKRLFRSSEQVVGEVFVPIKQLMDMIKEKTIMDNTNINYQVMTESGEPKGCLCLGFRFGSVIRGKSRGYDLDDVRVHDGCILGVGGIIRHVPSAPCEDDFYS